APGANSAAPRVGDPCLLLDDESLPRGIAADRRWTLPGNVRAQRRICGLVQRAARTVEPCLRTTVLGRTDRHRSSLLRSLPLRRAQSCEGRVGNGTRHVAVEQLPLDDRCRLRPWLPRDR